MAVDVALARSLAPDEGVLRLYRWSRPTLSFGRHQPAHGRYDPFAARGLGVDVVRRPTGGREVLHDRELTYSVALPLRHLSGVRESYRILNTALVDALRSLGVAAELAKPVERTPGPGAGPCFAAPAAGEVVVGGRKLAGSAQLRIGGVILQHGSILLGPPSVPVHALWVDGSGGGENESGATLADFIGDPIGFPRVAAAVEAAMAGTFGGKWVRGDLSEEERVVARAVLPRYESAEWTWRR
jgi:lipoyl(octanoyl) transferase